MRMYEWMLSDPRIRWMAMDQSGTVHGFSERPILDVAQGMWICSKGCYWGQVYQPEHVMLDEIVLKWEESLEERIVPKDGVQ